ncbi:MAG: hypothetical protein JWN13_266 [Betaproteobacteria bacterium]|jgi:hypothetical protein|nr:hypothetical protein [Betaproteobacteria bacterium]
MAVDPKEPGEGFVGRWSRLKTEAREAPVPTERPRVIADPDDAPPELPSLDKLTFDSDFKAFFHPKVDEDLRRAALRKLFSDPHFNVMDGLDVYIDDYSKSEPIPAAMLASLKQAQRIIDWANNKDDAPDESTPLEADARDSAAPALSATPALETAEAQLPIEPKPEADPVDKPELSS